MKKKNKHTFKLKRWPARKEEHATHIYPVAGARTTQIAEADRARFLAHPKSQAFIREYIPGEFRGLLPESADTTVITHVLVMRLNAFQQSRQPLTHVQAQALMARLSHE